MYPWLHPHTLTPSRKAIPLLWAWIWIGVPCSLIQAFDRLSRRLHMPVFLRRGFRMVSPSLDSFFMFELTLSTRYLGEIAKYQPLVESRPIRHLHACSAHGLGFCLRSGHS